MHSTFLPYHVFPKMAMLNQALQIMRLQAQQQQQQHGPQQQQQSAVGAA